MSDTRPRNKKELVVFLSLTVVVFAQAVWWIVFMARLVQEKVDLAVEFGADESYVAIIQDQEIHRQMMVGLEGIFFLALILAGAWLIYRSLLKAEEHKFNQQNFLLAVTHELKTPLASLKIYLSSLSSPKIPEEKKSGLIPKMRKDVVRLEKLVGDILEAGRFERSGYSLHPGRVNLQELVDRALTELSSEPSDKKLEIRTRPTEVIYCNADSIALGRALAAIFENSMKYNDKDSVILDVSLKEESDGIDLSITDNGIGLESGDIKKVFERFYRVGDEMKRSQPGTGLGLYLAREIVRAHGGELSAFSPGLRQGTTMKIRLLKDGKS